MKVKETIFEGVFILEPHVFHDNRGFFMESYNKKLLEENGINIDFVQDNHSFSKDAGVLRGLHYQLEPKAQTKLVRVGMGAIFDVIVDIRKKSKTFGKCFSIILSEENKRQLLIPKGFAHGFCTLVPNTIVMYKVDNYYDPEYDRGIRWDDPDLGIDWPVSIPILSEKDKKLPFLKNIDES
ncbi:dTDP-4-dehydrorhamnose 3,5-epimerase [Calidifontibacillus erzurumensis]|uniref:dTDP-4-dehydrorhamnose 3,5-epimerase n=1 Tax=Calidifontibacillus erzurumensis TaxID=2741433 RepID=A0A8J8GG02_9BACI|nr:dTDP-4-dehydrorhamnose 3,5-epimerase [Calidifontibacillus erzurumensis]NSL52677.1 dTDP-4-dehydrorhamnose 3,5-epimerase [Calidifontibacillus erzurumensis]